MQGLYMCQFQSEKDICVVQCKRENHLLAIFKTLFRVTNRSFWPALLILIISWTKAANYYHSFLYKLTCTDMCPPSALFWEHYRKYSERKEIKFNDFQVYPPALLCLSWYFDDSALPSPSLSLSKTIPLACTAVPIK